MRSLTVRNKGLLISAGVVLLSVCTAKHPVDPVRRASLQINGSVLRPTWLA